MAQFVDLDVGQRLGRTGAQADQLSILPLKHPRNMDNECLIMRSAPVLTPPFFASRLSARSNVARSHHIQVNRLDP